MIKGTAAAARNCIEIKTPRASRHMIMHTIILCQPQSSGCVYYTHCRQLQGICSSSSMHFLYMEFSLKPKGTTEAAAAGTAYHSNCLYYLRPIFGTANREIGVKEEGKGGRRENDCNVAAFGHSTMDNNSRGISSSTALCFHPAPSSSSG